MNKSLVLLCALSLSSGAQAWDGSVSTDYTKSFAPGDPFMSFSLDLSQNISKRSSFFVQQGLEKNLIIDSSQQEWEAMDTRLGFQFRPRSSVTDLFWTVSLATSLPVSPYSRYNEVITRPELRVGASYAVHPLLSLSLASFFRYSWNRYQSAPAEGDGEGGTALVHYTYGLSQGASLALSERWSLGYNASYREVKYEDIDYEASDRPFIDRRPEQGYSLSAFLAATLWESADISFGFQQGSILQQPGWNDYVLFDKEESSWSVSFSQGF